MQTKSDFRANTDHYMGFREERDRYLEHEIWKGNWINTFFFLIYIRKRQTKQRRTNSYLWNVFASFVVDSATILYSDEILLPCESWTVYYTHPITAASPTIDEIRELSSLKYLSHNEEKYKT